MTLQQEVLGLTNLSCLCCYARRQASYPYRLLALSLPSVSSSSTLSTITLALRLPSILSFDSLLSSPAVASTTTPLLSLVKIYQTGTLASFRQWVSANASVVSEHQLDERVLEKKMRVLALVGLCASKEDGEVSYQEIADALEVDEKDVEVWVIDGSPPPPTSPSHSLL